MPGKSGKRVTESSKGTPRKGSVQKGKEDSGRIQLFSWIGPLVMGLFILLSVALAILLVPPFIEADLQAFEDPESIWNSVFYIALVLLFTLFVLVVIKKNLDILVKAFMIFAVFLIVFYVAFGLIAAGGVNGILPMAGGAAVAVVFTVILLVYPEWFVIDFMGIIIAAGAIALFGISLSILPVLLLLVVLAIYDAIAVYRTGHMIDLAEGVIDMKMPILFILPRRRGYSFKLREPGQGLEEDRQDALFMGVGDAVIPSILPVSALVFIPPDIATAVLGTINLPALLAILGTMVGFVALMVLATGGRPQAGLPLLNGGSIAGYLIGCAVIGITFF